MSRRLKVFAGLLAVMALTAGTAACGSKSSSTASSNSAPSTTAAPAMSTADMRTKLNLLLGQHIIFASKATGAALGGRTDEYKAYGDLLNKNGADLGSLIGSVYGNDAQTKFNSIWSAHNGFFVDYTTALAKGDKAGQDKAVQDLTTQYVPQFTDLIAGATGLPADSVKSLTTEHVLQTKAIVDAQFAKKWTDAAKAQETAYAHMKMIGDAVAGGIQAKNASKFPADTAKAATDLRQKVDLALQDHLYLASQATGAALGGRNDEFTAYGTALNSNGTAIGSLLGSVYGNDAQTKFNSIWSAHNGFFVDYTKATATNDKAGQDKAVQALTTQYVPQFTDFITGATDLPKDTVQGLITEHVTGTKQIVDDQFAKDWTKTATDDKAAGDHMQMIGDPLSAAIVKKFADKFPANS